jgi:hypothetical protein
MEKNVHWSDSDTEKDVRGRWKDVHGSDSYMEKEANTCCGQYSCRQKRQHVSQPVRHEIRVRKAKFGIFMQSILLQKTQHNSIPHQQNVQTQSCSLVKIFVASNSYVPKEIQGKKGKSTPT